MEIRPVSHQLIPPVVKNLLLINVLIFAIVQTRLIPAQIEIYLPLYHWQNPIGLFRPWQFITHMFMHGSLMHLLFNMFSLWMFGSIMERRLGSKQFLQLYILSGLGAALCFLLTLNIEAYFGLPQSYVSACVGASGAIFGVLFAFAYIFPDAILQLYFAIPIKAKYAMMGMAAIDLFGGISRVSGDNIAHFAHLGGMLTAFILFKIWKIPYNSIRY